MDLHKALPWLVGQVLGLCVLSTTLPAAQPPIDPASADRVSSLLRTLPPELQELAEDVLDRNPDIARARHRAAAAAARAPQVSALPDPVAAVGLFVLSPETRVGPQQLSLSLSQRFPWMGKLKLKEKAALLSAGAATTRIEEVRLEKLFEVRRIAYELAFLDAYGSIVQAERGALVRYEQAAQAHYAAGTGLQQEIVRIQAQITRADTRLLEIAERGSELLSTLNGLRDRPADHVMPAIPLPEPGFPPLDRDTLIRLAESRRPELGATAADIAAHRALIELAEKGFRPDFNLGLSMTVVGRRDDELGRAVPPEGNGDDILALTGSMNLPIHRGKLDAAIEQAHAERRATEQTERKVRSEIAAAVGDLATRIPMLAEHLELMRSVLLKQAREALRSAETAYSLGKLNAVDLLDAEVVLFEVRIAAQRTHADLAIALARLERVIAAPLPQPMSTDHAP